MLRVLKGRWKLGVYFCASVIIATIKFLMLYESSPSFYVIGLKCSHKESMIIFGNLIVATMLFFGTCVQYLLFGELRLIETEHAYERSWGTVIGLIMSGSFYNGNINLLVWIFLASGLLVTKVFHCIVSDRLDWLIQQHYQKADSKFRDLLFNRILISLVFFIRFDFGVIKECIDGSFSNRSVMLLVIAFEFFLLIIDIIYCGIKFGLGVIEIYYLQKFPDEEVWSYKVWIDSVSKIIISLAKSIIIPTFIVFFSMLQAVPFSLLTEVFRAFYALGKSISTLYRLIKNAKKLNDSLKHPTKEEVEQADICIICRDDLVFGGTGNKRSIPMKLQCEHILHDGCIRSWLEMSNNCPTCRKPVITNDAKAATPASSPEVEAQLPPQENDMQLEFVNNDTLPVPDQHRESLEIRDEDFYILDQDEGAMNETDGEDGNNSENEDNYYDRQEPPITRQRKRLQMDRRSRRIESMFGFMKEVDHLNMSTIQRAHMERALEEAQEVMHSEELVDGEKHEFNMRPGSVVPIDWTVFPVTKDEAGYKVKLGENGDDLRMRIVQNERFVNRGTFEKYTIK